MSNNKITDKQDKTNTEIINKLYADKSNSEKHNSEIRYGSTLKIEDAEENKKYTKEMYALADKNEFKSNMVFWGIGLGIVFTVILFILFSSPYMKPKIDVVSNKVDTNNAGSSSSTENVDVVPVKTPNNIYEYLNVEENRTSSLNKAVELNKGSQKGITIYLLSEILRSNAYDIPMLTSSVEQLMNSLISMDWKKNTDYTQLEKGDICFTTDVPKKPGVPSFAYVFMGWVEEGKTEYAYVCDGQFEEFGDTLHKRNISISTTQKDKFSFFLRK